MSTTAAVGASAIAAGAGAMPLQSFNDEGTPILSASITASFEAGWADSSAASDTEEISGFINGRWGEVYFTGEMTADNGLTYGARINLQTTLGPGGNIGRANQGREYLYLKGAWGSLELGKSPGAETAMNLNIAGQYKGGGGLDWPWHNWQAKGDRPDSISVHNSPHWWDTQQTKATYFTPVMGGVQAGISYTPIQSSDDGVVDHPIRDEAKGGYRDEIGVGVQYNGDFGGATLSLSAVGAVSEDAVKATPRAYAFDPATGKGVPVKDADGNVPMTYAVTQGVGFYQIGGMISHSGFSVGVGYWDAGNFGAPKGVSQDYTSVIFDATYSFGPYGIEVSYASSSRDQTGGADGPDSRDTDAWAVGFGYAVAPGLRMYADLMGADYTVNGTSHDSTMVVGGVTLSF